MNDFISNAKSLSRNPLGIIALFISLVYGFACLVLGIAGDKLETCERIPLIYFLIGFPILILASFLFLVIKHHSKLYAPKDYRDENNFFKGYQKQQTADVNEVFDEIPDNVIDNLLSWSSVIGLYALYAVYLSKKHNVQFTLKNLEMTSFLLNESYTHGFLVATSSMGAFSLNAHDEPFEITKLHPRLEANIKDAVYLQADRQKQRLESNMLYQEIEKLENAFENSKKK